jgi:TatD DNase family protein
MKLIDTHCHLYAEEFGIDINEVIAKATEIGVEEFYLPAIDHSTLGAMLDLEKRFPQCKAMMGVHPCSIKADFLDELKLVEEYLGKRKFAAIGEIGLDFYWDKSFEQNQYLAFHKQIEWALHYDRPIVIHSRESMQESIAVVKEHQKGNLRGVFHCFSGNLQEAREIIDLGFFLGIGGVITYKKSNLPEIVREIGLQQIVLETDAPYLPPVPFRGKRNEPAYLEMVVQKLSEISDLPPEEVAITSTENAKKLFRD